MVEIANTLEAEDNSRQRSGLSILHPSCQVRGGDNHRVQLGGHGWTLVDMRRDMGRHERRTWDGHETAMHCTGEGNETDVSGYETGHGWVDMRRSHEAVLYVVMSHLMGFHVRLMSIS